MYARVLMCIIYVFLHEFTGVVGIFSSECTKKADLLSIGHPSLKHLSVLKRNSQQMLADLQVNYNPHFFKKLKIATRNIHSDHHNFSMLNGLLYRYYVSRLPFAQKYTYN